MKIQDQGFKPIERTVCVCVGGAVLCAEGPQSFRQLAIMEPQKQEDTLGKEQPGENEALCLAAITLVPTKLGAPLLRLPGL